MNQYQVCVHFIEAIKIQGTDLPCLKSNWKKEQVQFLKLIESCINTLIG